MHNAKKIKIEEFKKGKSPLLGKDMKFNVNKLHKYLFVKTPDEINGSLRNGQINMKELVILYLICKYKALSSFQIRQVLKKIKVESKFIKFYSLNPNLSDFENEIKFILNKLVKNGLLCNYTFCSFDNPSIYSFYVPTFIASIVVKKYFDFPYKIDPYIHMSPEWFFYNILICNQTLLNIFSNIEDFKLLDMQKYLEKNNFFDIDKQENYNPKNYYHIFSYKDKNFLVNTFYNEIFNKIDETIETKKLFPFYDDNEKNMYLKNKAKAFKNYLSLSENNNIVISCDNPKNLKKSALKLKEFLPEEDFKNIIFTVDYTNDFYMKYEYSKEKKENIFKIIQNIF